MRGASPPPCGQLRVERLAQRAAVAQPGQLVGARPLLQRLLVAHALGDVVEIDGQALGRGIDPVLEPAVVRRVVLLQQQRRLLGHRLLVVAREGLVAAFRELAPDVLADQVLRRAPEDLRRLRVDVGVDPVLVERDERIGDALEHLPPFGFLALALADVDLGAEEAQRNAGVVADQFAFGVHPQHRAVGAQHAVVEAVRRDPVDGAAHAGLGRRAVVRMHARHRGRQRLPVVAGRHAHDVEHLVRPVDFVGGQVPVEEAHPRHLLRLRQPRLDLVGLLRLQFELVAVGERVEEIAQRMVRRRTGELGRLDEAQVQQQRAGEEQRDQQLAGDRGHQQRRIIGALEEGAAGERHRVEQQRTGQRQQHAQRTAAAGSGCAARRTAGSAAPRRRGIPPCRPR